MTAAIVCGGLLLATGGGEQAGRSPTALVASAPLVRAEAVRQPHEALDAPIRIVGNEFVIHVICDAPYWRLLCTPMPLASDVGSAGPPAGSLQVTSTYHRPWEAPRKPRATSVEFPPGGAALVAEGISTAVAPGAGISITPTFLIDPLSPAGEWHGDLRFTLVGPDGKSVLAEQNVRVMFNLPAIGMVLFDPGSLSVRADRPGDHECDKPLRFRVVSNRTSLRVRVVLPGLARQGGPESVQAADIALAVGGTPQESLARLRQTPYGSNSVVVTVGRGVTEQHVSVRIRSTTSMPPGQYQGVVTAEVMG